MEEKNELEQTEVSISGKGEAITGEVDALDEIANDKTEVGQTAPPIPAFEEEIKVEKHGISAPPIDTRDAVEQTLPEEDSLDPSILAAVKEAAAEGAESVSGSTTLGDGREVSYSIQIKPVSKIDPEVEDETPGREDPTPSPAQRESFDPNAIQDPLKPSQGPEGGVTFNKSPNASSRSEVDDKSAGGMLKPTPDMSSESREGKYEMTGFEVSYSADGKTHRVHIRDYFDDLDSAKATVANGKYLMPMPNRTFKLAEIHGQPTISLNEREVCSIQNGMWSRR